MSFARTFELPRECNGYFQITDLSSAVPCPGVGDTALIQAEDIDIRLRLDGVDPTASVGHLLAAGDSIQVSGDLKQIKMIETGASAKANIHVFK